MPEVRLIGETASRSASSSATTRLRYARERDLDLVEVAPEAKPPVCRVLDYSKYKYEQAQKQKRPASTSSRSRSARSSSGPRSRSHDYDTKKGHVMRFLHHRDKVKVTIMFRGREVAHPERGAMLLDRLAEELGELAVVEQRPIQDGRNMTMMLGPGKPAGAPKARRQRAEAAEDAEIEATCGAGGAERRGRRRDKSASPRPTAPDPPKTTSAA